jgi:integrase
MADSALRLTEAKRLTRAQLDFGRKIACVEARNTKKNKQTRMTPLSDRLVAELQIWAAKAEDDDTPILEQGDHKKAWKAVKKAAGISDDLQLRDLRGWGTSKIARALAANNLPWQWGMKATGHTQTKTYERYLKVDEEVARQTGEALKKIEKKVA